MPFSGPFREPFVAPIFSPGGVTPWYLLGGVTAAQCVAAYQPKGAASLAASKVNLAHPGTNDAAAGTDPSFATGTGWTLLGSSSQYLTTGIVPVTQTWSALMQFSGVNTSGYCGRAFGAGNAGASKEFGIIPSVPSVYYLNGATRIVAPSLASGNLAIGGNQGYRNGVAEGAAIGAGTGAAVADGIVIGATNLGGTVSQYFTGSIQAWAVYNITLSSTQIALIAAAMAAL